MSKIITFLSAIAIVVGVFLTIESIQQSRQPALEEISFDATSPYIVSRRDIAETKEAVGITIPSSQEKISLSSNCSGEIDDILVKQGSQVEPGQVLALVSQDKSTKNLNQLKLLVEKLEADLAWAVSHPDVSTIEYWDQSVVDEAEKNLTLVIARSNQNVESAQEKVNLYQSQLEVILAQLNDLAIPSSSSLKSAAKAELIKNYFTLDRAMWLHDRIQTTYFMSNDQESLRVREKEAEAFNLYYTVKWYMDNHILNSAPDWAVTETFEKMRQALQKLIIAYNTTVDAFKDPFYSPQLSPDHKEDIEDAREDIAKALAFIIEAQAEWQNSVNGSSNESRAVLVAQKEQIETSLEKAKFQLESAKINAKSAISQADASLKEAYLEALKTKTISTPKSITPITKELEKARTDYNQALAQKTDACQIKSPIEGEVFQIFPSLHSSVTQGQKVIEISPRASSLIIKATPVIAGIDLLDEVSVRTSSSISVPGIITEIASEYFMITPEKDGLDEGEQVSVLLSLKEKKNALAIPKDYLFEQEGRNFVKMIIDGKPLLQEVRIGLSSQDWIEILEGLTEEDVIFP